MRSIGLVVDEDSEFPLPQTTKMYGSIQITVRVLRCVKSALIGNKTALIGNKTKCTD